MVVMIAMAILHASLFTLHLNAQVAHVSYTSSRHYNQRVAEFERMEPLLELDRIGLRGNPVLIAAGGSCVERRGDLTVEVQKVIDSERTIAKHREWQIIIIAGIIILVVFTMI